MTNLVQQAAPAVARQGRGRLPGQADREGVAWSDSRVERLLAASACTVLVLIVAMIVFVFSKAWPSFAGNGLSWFGSGGSVDQQLGDIFNSPANPSEYVYELSGWPLWGTALTTLGAVAIGLAFSLFASIFIVEFAPPRLNRVLEPVVRLPAAVPSVVYGLIGVLVPFVGNHLISSASSRSRPRAMPSSAGFFRGGGDDVAARTAARGRGHPRGTPLGAGTRQGGLLGDWCQTAVSKKAKTSLEKRRPVSPSPALRRVGPPDLMSEIEDQIDLPRKTPAS